MHVNCPMSTNIITSEEKKLHEVGTFYVFFFKCEDEQKILPEIRRLHKLWKSCFIV